MKLTYFKLLLLTSFVSIVALSHAQSEGLSDNLELDVKAIVEENAKELYYDFLEQPTLKDKNYYSILRMASNASQESGICSVMANKMLQSAQIESDKFSNLIDLKLREKINKYENITLADIKTLNIYEKIVTVSKEQLLSKDTITKVYEIRNLANKVIDCMNEFKEQEKKKNSI